MEDINIYMYKVYIWPCVAGSAYAIGMKLKEYI